MAPSGAGGRIEGALFAQIRAFKADQGQFLFPGILGLFLDALEIDSTSIAGLSMGGFAAARFAAQNPDRIKRLALLDSAGFGRDLPWGFRLSAMPVLKHILTRPQRWVHERFFATIEVVRPREEHNDAYLEYAFNVTRNEGHSLAVRENMPVFANLRGQRNLLTDDELGSIRAETLVIWGEQDRFFPVEHARRAERLIPDVQLELLPDCGHICLLDQPQRVSQLLSEFMRGN